VLRRTRPICLHSSLPLVPSKPLFKALLVAEEKGVGPGGSRSHVNRRGMLIDPRVEINTVSINGRFPTIGAGLV
jgi:hypothetical protein